MEVCMEVGCAGGRAVPTAGGPGGAAAVGGCGEMLGSAPSPPPPSQAAAADGAQEPGSPPVSPRQATPLRLFLYQAQAR